MPNVLLLYPEFPSSFWSFKHALEFAGKRAAMPPLGLLTVAGMFPYDYRLKLIDMNVEDLRDRDLRWADLVCTSSMVVQRDSLGEVIERCHSAGVPVAAGGPYPTSYFESIQGVDYFLLDEVEDTLPEFLRDLRKGGARRIYRAPVKPAVIKTPLPRYTLINFRNYGSVSLQFSRGCPFDCDFCDITKLFGRVPRTKSIPQVLTELDLLYMLGWRGPIFFVDDNFIGNKRAAHQALIAIAKWQKARRYPFSFFTEASVNLVELEPLMDAMVEAGFNFVFLGIETPNPKALLKMKKVQNVKRGQEEYLSQAVRKIQQKGIEVSGGFILGLDEDTAYAFDGQIEFIEEAAIPMAMVGLLTILRGTDLYKRMEREERLLGESTGNNLDTELNFIPQLPREILVAGYKRVLAEIYDSSLTNYFNRCFELFRRINAAKLPRTAGARIGPREIFSFIKSMLKWLPSRQGASFLKFFTKVLAEYPEMAHRALVLAAKGHHFRMITEEVIVADELKRG